MWVWMELFSLILVWTIYSLYMMVDDWLVWGLYYPISWGLSQSGNPWPSVVSDCLRMGKVVTRGVWSYQLPWPFSCTCVGSACLDTETGHSLKLHVMFNVQCLHFLKIYDPLKHAIPTWIPLGKCRKMVELSLCLQLAFFNPWYWVNYNDLTATSLEIMVSKGNYPQMALIQVSEIL